MAQSVEKQITLKPDQVKEKIVQFVDNNCILESKGLLKNSINFVGEPGVAKTSSIIQACIENNIGYEKINLANIDDLGDICGFPCVESEMTFKEKDGNIIHDWVNNKAYDFKLNQDWHPTGRTRTAYSEPKWVSNLRNHEKSVLILDDSLRAQQRFINATMDLIDRGEYMGWKTPKGCTIVMTNNPSDGDFQVSQVDAAQSSRYFTFNVEYCQKSWAKQAEKEGIHGACINFILKEHSSLFMKDKQGTMKSMPRQWSKLFNSIMFLPNLSSKESLMMINENGKGILPEALVQIFVDFLHKKDWDIPEPEFVFTAKTDAELIKKMKEVVGDIMKPETFRNDIASIFTLRLINYIANMLSKENLETLHVERLKCIMENKILGSDLDFKLLRDVYHANPQKAAKLILHPFFQKGLFGGK
jgi:hypothetical protein